MAIPSQSSINIYAELLSNIRQISVAVSLGSSSDATTNAQVVKNGTAIEVHHQGQTKSLDLPAHVESVATALPIAPTPSSRLNWRLPLSPFVPRPSQFSLETQAIPWESKDIDTGSGVRCRKCDHSIVSRDSISSWRDLPSENWAEMMEFWHCHKPHDEEHEHHTHASNSADADSLAKRGYGASNVISAKPGIGFVDLVSFMFSEPDCSGLLAGRSAWKPFCPQWWKRVPAVMLDGQPPVFSLAARAMGVRRLQEAHLFASGVGLHVCPRSRGEIFSTSSYASGVPESRLILDESTALKYLLVFCEACQAEIGLYNVHAASVTLFKWQVLCETSTQSQPPSSLQCLSATLTATISRSGSAKSVIMPYNLATRGDNGVDESSRLAFHLWVLNPHLVYASSSLDGVQGAMKVLYRIIDCGEGNKMVESLTSDVQEISLPASVIEAARDSLETSTLILPEHERQFREWSVGLLDRWRPE